MKIYKEIKDVEDLKYYDVSSSNPIMLKLQKSERKRLYHYTTKDGAKGILTSNKLWITQSEFLDDTTEIKYISFVLGGVILYLKENKELYDIGVDGQFYVYEAIIETLIGLRETYIYGPPIKGGNLYILSLTENKNNKYLIENYCRKDGVIFEFENNINNVFKKDKNMFTIFSAKVEYDYRRQMTLILEDINEFYSELLSNLIKEKKVDFMELKETIKSVIYAKIINYSFFFKNSKFSKEEEYRMLFIMPEEYKSILENRRIKYNKEIPYIEIEFNIESLLNKNIISEFLKI